MFLLNFDAGEGSNVPGVSVSDHALYLMVRVTGACEEHEPQYIAGDPSATPPREASGSIQFDDDHRVTRAHVEASFDAAPDGSLGPTQHLVFAEDVYLLDECP